MDNNAKAITILIDGRAREAKVFSSEEEEIFVIDAENHLAIISEITDLLTGEEISFWEWVQKEKRKEQDRMIEAIKLGAINPARVCLDCLIQWSNFVPICPRCGKATDDVEIYRHTTTKKGEESS